MKSDRWKKMWAGGKKGSRWEKNIFRILFWALFVIMAVYYAYRLFALTPWYDELYTYYCFISKGPVYAAIHWPLPNNHVGYSVLSACFDYLGNPYIGLRGVSYLCALANMYLIYKIAGRSLEGAYRPSFDVVSQKGLWYGGDTDMGGFLPLVVVLLYISMYLVNQLAVQGRGYTLGITCYLTAWLCVILICEEDKVAGRFYVIYVLALILGLYTVSSNVYWVVPLCLAGGTYLLVKGIQEVKEGNASFLKTKGGTKLARLIAASLVAAMGTVFLYGIIWVSIGSNLLVKDETSIYYGMGHVKMILQSPFSAIGRGMEYMLDTPYIQSEDRAGFAGRLWEWLLTLSGYSYNSFSIIIILIWTGGILFLAFKIVQGIKGSLNGSLAVNFSSIGSEKEDEENLLLYLFLFMGIIFVPVCLLLQCKRPYYRVFTYSGVLLAFLLGVILRSILEAAFPKVQGGRGRKGILTGLLCLIVVFALRCFGFSRYNDQYGLREHEIADAFSEADIGRWENFCVTDCNQEYLLYFLYGIRCENKEVEGADVVLLDKRMTNPEFDEMVWEFYHYYDTIPWEYIEKNMEIVYENENYILYTHT